jgi:hypothetical protein
VDTREHMGAVYKHTSCAVNGEVCRIFDIHKTPCGGPGGLTA